MTQQLFCYPEFGVSPPPVSHIAPPLPTYDASALMAGGIQAQIVLADQVYTLRITRAGKLILTK